VVTDIDVSFSIRGVLLQVDISDYGKGVEPDESELITAESYRGENAQTRKR